jgi:hypothetical protein
MTEELQQGFDHLPKYHKNFYYEILIQELVKTIFSKRQLGIRVYIRTVMIMVLVKSAC